MNSLQKRQLRLLLTGGLVAAALVGLVVWSVCRTPAAEQEVADLTSSLRGKDWKNMSGQERENWRRQWERLRPETRRAVARSLVREEIERFREESANLTPAARAARIDEAIRKMREHHRGVGDAERELLQERMDSAEGKAMLQEMLNVYQTDFTARERAELDPLVHEMLYNVQQTFGN